jgi:hypothetical protein
VFHSRKPNSIQETTKRKEHTPERVLFSFTHNQLTITVFYAILYIDTLYKNIEKEVLISMEKYFEMGMVRGLDVKIINRELTVEESRRIYKRRPFSKFAESRFGGNRDTNDSALVSLGKGRPCKMCQAVTRNEFLRNETCPDCDGRSEAGRRDPHLELPLHECCGGPRREGNKSVFSRKCCGGRNHHE